MLVDKAEYLSAGIHMGMKGCTEYMKNFVYKTREDGLSVFNLQEVDNKINASINMLSKYNKILVISNRESSAEAIRKFATLVNGKAIAGRFSPGTLTNPSYRNFYEPDIVVVVDAFTDKQGIEEAKKRRVPIIGLCGTMCSPENIDLVIPINNNSRKSLALFFWILARGIMKVKGSIKKDDEFKETLKDFGDIGKPKKSTSGELETGGDFDVDIDIEIEGGEKKIEKIKSSKDKKPKKITTKKSENPNNDPKYVKTPDASSGISTKEHESEKKEIVEKATV